MTSSSATLVKIYKMLPNSIIIYLFYNKSFNQTSARDSDNPPEEVQVWRESCTNGQAELEDSLPCGNKVITELQ
jgi:hypothetical protein